MDQPKTAKDMLDLIKQAKIAYVACRFMDFPGQWQEKVYAAKLFDESIFEKGLGFDGSCVKGWQRVNEADMLLFPSPETACIDPFYQHPTLSVICDIKDPATKKQYSRDPRSIARKAEHYLLETGFADQAMFSPEMEFFVFDSVSYDQRVEQAHYRIDSVEGQWNRGNDDPMNSGRQIRVKEGYFPTAPADTLGDVRTAMMEAMTAMGLPVESHHHEVATGGQCEIDLSHRPLLGMADAAVLYKHVVKCVAARHGKTATFMPKPLHRDNGSGMHTHFSLVKDGQNILAGRRYAGLSQIGLYAVGGILKHARALIALTNPTTNSFKRLVPGYEAPVSLIYSTRNRSAAIRLPIYSKSEESRRLEIRFPDGSANPYLAFSAILMAALDGIQNQIEPGDPVDREIEELSEADRANIAVAPHDLDEALRALEADHAFLLAGDVFPTDLIEYWIHYKRENEVEALRSRPHPYEFCIYYDA